MNPRLKVLKKWTLSLEHLFLSLSTFEFRTKWKEFIQDACIKVAISQTIVESLRGHIWIDEDDNADTHIIFSHPQKFPHLLLINASDSEIESLIPQGPPPPTDE